MSLAGLYAIDKTQIKEVYNWIRFVLASARDSSPRTSMINVENGWETSELYEDDTVLRTDISGLFGS
jgi:hypothetical protein